MNHDLDIDDTTDLDWMAGQQPQRIPSDPFVTSDPFARERALQALVRHMGTDPGRRRSGLRRLLGPRTLGFAAAAGGVALLAVVLLSSGGTDTHSAGGPTGGTAHSAPVATGAARQPLMQLADYVSKSPAPTGDATVVQRTTTLEGRTATVYDLYADDGRYYFAESRQGLAGAIADGQDEDGGTTARELAAAKKAASGDVGAAAEDMASAPDPSHPVSPSDAGTYDNSVWEWSQQAIIAGAGKPEIRAGVLRILATLPGVTVAEGTADGASTLVLTAGSAEMGPDYIEQLTIDAETGVPIKFVGGPPQGPPATTVDYQVTRADYAGLSSSTGAAE